MGWSGSQSCILGRLIASLQASGGFSLLRALLVQLLQAVASVLAGEFSETTSSCLSLLHEINKASTHDFVFSFVEAALCNFFFATVLCVFSCLSKLFFHFQVSSKYSYTSFDHF